MEEHEGGLVGDHQGIGTEGVSLPSIFIPFEGP
jgi:hypothetical protein